MGNIKEPKGVDFLVKLHVVLEEDRRIISEAIAHYKVTGKFKKIPAPKRTRTNSKKKSRADFQFYYPVQFFGHFPKR